MDEHEMLTQCTHRLRPGQCLFRGVALHANSDAAPLPPSHFFLCDDEEEATRYAKEAPNLVYTYRVQRPLALFDMRALSDPSPARKDVGTPDARAHAELAQSIRRWFCDRARDAEHRAAVDAYFDSVKHPVREAPPGHLDKAVLQILEEIGDGNGAGAGGGCNLQRTGGGHWHWQWHSCKPCQSGLGSAHAAA
jgi:hypothetical protein